MTTPQIEATQQLEAQNQQLQEQVQRLESRVTSLETELVALKEILLSQSNDRNWGKQILGTFADCPEFDEAERFGREWRKSYQEPFDPPE